MVPLLAAAAVFAFVLVTTPPGLSAVYDVMFISSSGPLADAAAYALGAAASLALLTLLVLAAACGALSMLLRRSK
jgi:hypothetical protein